MVLIHGSASSSGQWRPLMERLSDRFRVIAPDLYGHGRTPPWREERGMALDDEVDLLEPVFRMAGDSFHLIGHSWGGAIALKAALRHMARLKSLILYEPALWSLLVSSDPAGIGTREIIVNRDETQKLMDKGEFTTAAAYFIDYWVGQGTWDRMNDARRSAFATGMGAASPEWHASFHEATPLSAFSVLDVPALLLSGTGSTAPARTMTRLLASVLPRARTVHLDGPGHMGPPSPHPEAVNRAIDLFSLIPLGRVIFTAAPSGSIHPPILRVPWGSGFPRLSSFPGLPLFR